MESVVGGIYSPDNVNVGDAFSGQARIEFRNRLVQLGKILCRSSGRGPLGRQGLKPGSQLVQVEYLALGDRPDDGAAITFDNDKALSIKAAQAFPDRSPGQVEFLADALLDEPLTRLVATFNDRLPNLAVGEFGAADSHRLRSSL